jgi:hypothetical protein
VFELELQDAADGRIILDDKNAEGRVAIHAAMFWS